MIRCSVPAVLSLFALIASVGTEAIGGTVELARELHFQSIVIDTHDDTTQRFLDPAFDLGTRQSSGSIDIPRAREGGLDALFFSVWIPGTVTGPLAVDNALVQIEAVHRQIAAHPADLLPRVE